MPQYNPPLRDMQFVMHEVLDVVAELKALPEHADVDADTINAVLEEGGKFAAAVVAPLNQSGDAEGCTLDRAGVAQEACVVVQREDQAMHLEQHLRRVGVGIQVAFLAGHTDRAQQGVVPGLHHRDQGVAHWARPVGLGTAELFEALN